MADDRFVREKLVHQGVTTLSDAELVSIIVRDGAGMFSAVELAEKILESAGGSLSQLARTELKSLRKIEGLGVKKAAMLSAALELGRRLKLECADEPSVIHTNDDVVKIFRPQIADLPHEEFWVLYLSSANTVIDKSRVSLGGVSGTVVDHRIIVKRAVELLCSGLILVHNHPSGVALPSADDKALTARISEAAKLFDISVLDHLIITPGECFSFRRVGLVK